MRCAPVACPLQEVRANENTKSRNANAPEALHEVSASESTNSALHEVSDSESTRLCMGKLRERVNKETEMNYLLSREAVLKSAPLA